MKLHLILVICVIIVPILHAKDELDQLIDQSLSDHGLNRKPQHTNPPIEQTTITTTLLGSGFHRSIKYTIDSSPTSSHQKHCTAAILQPLPSNIYANIYELQNAASLGLGPKVKLFGPTDVENITEYAHPTVITAYTPFDIISSSTSHQMSLVLPLHARYPKVVHHHNSSDDYILSPIVRVQIPEPLFLLKCATRAKTHENEEKEEENTHWQQIQLDSSKPSPVVIWDVPAANQLHEYTIIFTSFVVFVSGVTVVWYIVFSPKKEKINID